MELSKVIGMESIKAEMEKLIKNINAYKKGGARIPNYIINLDAGNGQTLATEIITDILVDNKLREFHGLDEYLEYKPDGSMADIKLMFADIEDNAVYDNGYKGVVSIDVTKLVNVQNGYEMKYFEEHIKKVSETATIIIYCSSILGIKGTKLKERISNIIGNVREINVSEYTSENFANMVIQNITERGISISEANKVVKVLSEVISKNEVKSAKEAVELAEKLVFYADYSGLKPILNFGKANDFKKNYSKEI